MTSRRLALLAFIKAQAEKGRFPLRSEMARHMGWKNVSSVQDALWALVRDGHLRAIQQGRHFKFEVVA